MLSWSSPSVVNNSSVTPYSCDLSLAAQGTDASDAFMEIKGDLSQSLIITGGGVFIVNVSDSSNATVYLRGVDAPFQLTVTTTITLAGTDTRGGTPATPSASGPFSDGALNITRMFTGRSSTSPAFTQDGQQYSSVSLDGVNLSSSLSSGVGYSQILFVTPFTQTMTGSYDTTFNFTSLDQPPVAAIALTTAHPLVGADVHFDDDSYDPDVFPNGSPVPPGGIASALWAVTQPDGTQLSPTTFDNHEVSGLDFLPTEVGQYTVQLTVTDQEGNTATATNIANVRVHRSVKIDLTNFIPAVLTDS